MDLSTYISHLLASGESAFVVGMVAAFTPCVLAIIPLMLYRFGIWGNDKTKRSRSQIAREVVLLLLGYFISFAISGIVFQSLNSSQFVNATRLTIGMLLLLIGILQLAGKLNIQIIQRAAHPFLLGLLLPLIVSFSPCVLPYFATLVVTSIDVNTLSKFMLFGLGVLTPAIVISLSGRFALNFFRRSGKFFNRVEKLSAVLIVVSGFYLATHTIQINSTDIAIGLLALLIIIVYFLYRIAITPRLRVVHNYINWTGVALLWLMVAVHLLTIAPGVETMLVGSNLIYACGSSHTNCELCLTVAWLLSLVVLATAWGIINLHVPGKKIRLSSRA